MDNLYTAKAKQVLKNAEEIASELNHSYIGTEHILAALISVEDCSASIILRNNKVEYDNIVDLIEKLVAPSAGIEVLDKDIFTPRVKEMLEYAKNYTGITGDKQVGTNHILLALLREKEGVATRLLNTIGVNVRKIYSDILEVMGVAPSEFKNEINAIFGDNNGNSKPDFISQYSVDLTRKAMNGEMDPVIGREKEILRVIQILSRRTKNNPCLVGEPGVGKTAIVEGIAMRIANGMVPDTVKNKRVLTLDVASMVAGSKYRGEFEERIKRIINEVKEDKNILLFLDEIHTIIGAGGAEGSMDAANILKPALSRGEIQIIGATTLEEYRKYFEKDAALERRFQPVKVEAPSAEESICILNGLKERYEVHHGVTISDEAIKASVELSDRYINDRFLPDKAIDLMDEASAKIKIQKMTTENQSKATTLRSDLRKIQDEKIEALKNRDYKLVKELKDSEEELKKQLEKELKKSDKKKIKGLTVTAKDVEDVVAMWTNIPVSKLSEKEESKLRKLETTLSKRVIGQPEAIKAVSNAIRRGRVGLKDPKRPIGSFLFLGPTGVGKTELSKAIADSVFGNEKSMIRVDMSEYMEKHSVSKLIGSPPGYVGYDDGGQLSERVRRNPYSVVLFDEIEKAHPDVFNILLQILDEGNITDNTGRKIDFKNTVIIMTSNVGAQRIIEPKHLGFIADNNEEKNYESMKNNVMEEIKQLFKPELLNRIDEIIVFHSLQKEQMLEIVNIMIKEITVRAEKIGINLKVTPQAKQYIIDQSFDKKYGARPLRRKLQTMLEDQLAQQILEGKIKNENTVNVVFKEKQLEFKVKK
ncbi:MAG: ATP-dependent Clp protease ATP-binding subunit [Lachnospiraceae bacterium]|nr:ATP-dependent Clp protease ATP-binding subunit [Lachnospiraceae bacterium]